MPHTKFGFSISTPPVVLNLIIINALMLLLTYMFRSSFSIDLVELLGLYYPGSEHFRPYQIVTHMFMHGGIDHLVFNMLALWMFGRVLEQVWEGKRFLFYYLATGLGAAALHTLVNFIEITHLQNQANALLVNFTPETFSAFVQSHFADYYPQVLDHGLAAWTQDPSNLSLMAKCQELTHELIHLQMDIPTVGASGAVFGVLLAFGVLFPNAVIYLLIPPIPIKAKWFVILYAGLELYLGVSQPGSTIAHFAHLGGMLFGLLILWYWRRSKN